MEIKFFVMDVDGTLTDGMIYMGNEGELFKAFNAKDGYGIHHLVPGADMVPVIITGRNSRILENRCRELEINELHQGINNKTEVLDRILREYSAKEGTEYTYKNVAYIGDDLNDLRVMVQVKEGGGITACPADAVKEIKAVSVFVAERNGGRGAVRDFIDYLVQ